MPPASDKLIEANALTYSYHGQSTPSVHNVSLAVRAGERLLISGASGCGKSTLARCLVGLIPHLYKGQLEGQVWLDSLRTDSTLLWQLAEKAGMVLQNTQAQMLASTVEDEIAFGLENLGLPRQEIERRIESSLDRFGLQKLRTSDPRRISGGEGQRAMLAAMLARRPSSWCSMSRCLCSTQLRRTNWSATWQNWPGRAAPSWCASIARVTLAQVLSESIR